MNVDKLIADELVVVVLEVEVPEGGVVVAVPAEAVLDEVDPVVAVSVVAVVG